MRTAEGRPAGSAVALTLAAVLLLVGSLVHSGQASVTRLPALPLSWAPPALTDPVTRYVSAAESFLSLLPRRDHVLVLPRERLELRSGLTIEGGDDVVLVGGHLRILGDAGRLGRGLLLRGQTGTVHVEGLLIDGPGLGEGIDLDQRQGAVVQLQNIRVESVTGALDRNHADVLQTWAGPRRLLVDRLSGRTRYQGLFLLPEQRGTTEVELVDLRRVDLEGTAESAYLAWRSLSAQWPLLLTEVWMAPSPHKRGRASWLRPSGPGRGDWLGVREGRPPGGQFVPAGAVGIGYLSPGYL